MKIFAYVISSLVGYVFGHFLLSGAAAAYASILISYHLFLIFLIASTEQKTGFSLPIFQTIFTHAAFLALLISLPYMREQIPLFSLISFLIPGLAPFETKWLFSGREGSGKLKDLAPHQVPEATAEDQEDFLAYLRQEHRPFRKPGMTIEQEFKAWLTDRAKKKMEAEALLAPASMHANNPAGSGLAHPQ